MSDLATTNLQNTELIHCLYANTNDLVFSPNSCLQLSLSAIIMLSIMICTLCASSFALPQLYLSPRLHLGFQDPAPVLVTSQATHPVGYRMSTKELRYSWSASNPLKLIVLSGHVRIINLCQSSITLREIFWSFPELLLTMGVSITALLFIPAVIQSPHPLLSTWETVRPW